MLWSDAPQKLFARTTFIRGAPGPLPLRDLGVSRRKNVAHCAAVGQGQPLRVPTQAVFGCRGGLPLRVRTDCCAAST